MAVLQRHGFTCKHEREHAVDAWLATHPGNREDSVRRTPQSTFTLAHLMPGLSAVYTGAAWDEALQEPSWYVAHTRGRTRFNVNAYVMDNGHYLVLGPTRAGRARS